MTPFRTIFFSFFYFCCRLPFLPPILTASLPCTLIHTLISLLLLSQVLSLGPRIALPLSPSLFLPLSPFISAAVHWAIFGKWRVAYCDSLSAKVNLSSYFPPSPPGTASMSCLSVLLYVTTDQVKFRIPPLIKICRVPCFSLKTKGEIDPSLQEVFLCIVHLGYIRYSFVILSFLKYW